MILSTNMLKRVGESRLTLSDSNCCSEPISYAAVEEDGTCGLVIQVFDDSNKVCADVVLLHGCPQSCMPNSVEGLLEVYEDMQRSCWCWRYFSHRMRRLKICSVVLHNENKYVIKHWSVVFSGNSNSHIRDNNMTLHPQILNALLCIVRFL